MALEPGTRLGPYEIASALGAGGMGEVYRARDTRLGREVAIKVLPAAYSANVDRLRRFEQEARAAAALSHPNILAVHDIGTAADAPFIVSELLEGETLRDRLRSGPIPVRKAIELALQIARGLQAAHDKGIIHRDLKPENVFVTADNRVKILDFGLAKLTQEDRMSPGASAVPTAPSPTEPGMVLGTVGYMAPEQVRGVSVDHRADLFAFGAILYELVSGRRAFGRSTPAESMAAILNDEPPALSGAAPPIPPTLVRIVNRCLEKRPSDRFQTASDLAFALDAVTDGPGTSVGSAMARGDTHRQPPWWLGWAAAAALLAMLAPIAFRHLREREVPSSPIRFQIAPTVELTTPANFSLSPNGRHLVFVGRGPDRVPRLWVRDMDSLDVRALPGSETREITPPPFWSPDGRFVAFDSGGKLKKLALSGGLPQTLCDLPSVAVGGSWNRDGDIIVGNITGGLLHVRETGGPVAPVTAVDPGRPPEFHVNPSFLPDGRHFVYSRVSPTDAEAAGTYVGSLDTKPEDQPAKRLLPYEVGLTYAPSVGAGPGRLLFVREGTLMAQPFDDRRLAVTGEPVPVIERVGLFRDTAFFSVSDDGTLVYRSTSSDLHLAWFDRQGLVSGPASEPGDFRSVSLSPDGTRAIASRTSLQDTAKADLWLFDFARGGGATRLTFGDRVVDSPLWSPDGSRIVFTYGHNTLRQKLASGEGDDQEILRRADIGDVVWASSWSPDGRFVAITVGQSRTGSFNLMALPMDTLKPVPLVETDFSEEEGHFSPDGRWLAYASNQSGAHEIYVRRFSGDAGGLALTGGNILVSRGGGRAPRWRGDGRELFYVGPEGTVMAVEVATGPAFQAGPPTPLFQPPPGTIVGDVSPDGKRFLLVTPTGPGATVPFTVVMNWATAMKP